MRRLLMSTLVAPAFALALLAAAPVQAAQITYQFIGQCGDCLDVGTGTLVLNDYAPGSPDVPSFDKSLFVSFRYSSNLLSFDSTDPNSGSWNLTDFSVQITGEFGDGEIDIVMDNKVAQPPGPSSFTPSVQTFEFHAHTSLSQQEVPVSSWCAGPTPATCGPPPQGNNADYGGDYTISLVPPTETPEPATLALLGAGLVGLGLARRRRRG